MHFPVAVQVFARAPEPGLSKTRLIPALGAERARHAAPCSGRGRAGHRVPGRHRAGHVVVHTGPASCRTRRAVGGPRHGDRNPARRGLGERMFNALRDGLDACPGALVIGSDCPFSPPEILVQRPVCWPRDAMQWWGPPETEVITCWRLDDYPMSCFTGWIGARAGCSRRRGRDWRARVDLVGACHQERHRPAGGSRLTPVRAGWTLSAQSLARELRCASFPVSVLRVVVRQDDGRSNNCLGAALRPWSSPPPCSRPHKGGGDPAGRDCGQQRDEGRSSSPTDCYPPCIGQALAE